MRLRPAHGGAPGVRPQRRLARPWGIAGRVGYNRWTVGERPHTIGPMSDGSGSRWMTPGGRTIPDPGAGRGRDLAGPRRDTAAPDGRRGRPRRAGGHPPRPLHGPALPARRTITEQLCLDAPIVCNSGAIVKDPASHGTLWRADFDPALAADVRACSRPTASPRSSSPTAPRRGGFPRPVLPHGPRDVRRLCEPEPSARRG